MNEKQEKALFGNVLPGEVPGLQNRMTLKRCLHLYVAPRYEDYEIVRDLARSQREAIGALIAQMWLFDYEMDISIFGQEAIDCLNNDVIIWRSDLIRIIIEAVIQETWEEVRKAWEDNQ